MNPEPHERLPVPLLPTALAASGLGLAELAWLARSYELAPTESVWNGALGVALAYGTLGLAAALLLRVLGRVGLRVPGGREGVAPLACAVFAFFASAAWPLAHWSPTAVRMAEFGMAALFALTLYLVLRWATGRLAFVSATRTWVGVHAVALLVLAFGARTAATTPARGEAQGPSALLITIDTLRADALGSYGHDGARTPVLDGLANDGWLFEHAITPAVLTGPSHTSILSGLLPVQHGLSENAQRVGHDVRTMAETLGNAGYDTSAFVSGYPVSNQALGILERFGHWDDDMREECSLPRSTHGTTVGRFLVRLMDSAGVDLEPSWRKAPRVTDAATAWLDEGGERPFFSWVHYYDPHLPYEAPGHLVPEEAHTYDGPRGEGWYKLDPHQRREVIVAPGAVDRMGQLYDAEITLVDNELERLIESARRRAGPEGLWIVITSDHGEAFGEHGIYYRRELYDASLRVPLIVVPPEGVEGRQGGMRIAQQVRLIDVAPTLMHALGLAEELPTEGVSLLPLVDGAPTGAPGPSVSTIFTSRADPYQRFLIAVRNGRWKSIWRAEGWLNSDAKWEAETRELYDLDADPDELHNLATEMPELWERLRSMAGEVDLELRPSETLSEEELAVLRSLGYTM